MKSPSNLEDIEQKALDNLVTLHPDEDAKAFSLNSEIASLAYSISMLDKVLSRDIKPTKGLCSTCALSSRLDIFKSWPYYSGSLMYPVPSVNDGMTTMGMYNISSGYTKMYEGEYGELRMSLARHVREKLIIELLKLLESSNI